MISVPKSQIRENMDAWAEEEEEGGRKSETST